MKKDKKATLILSAVLLLSLILWTVWGNTALTVTEYSISSSRLPDAFSGFRIAQISDLHNTVFGSDNQKLLSMLRSTGPDMILLTGDLVDSRNTDIEAAILFAEQAASIAPCYYVSGNHEARLAEYPQIKTMLQNSGVTVLENQQVLIERNGEFLSILGIEDPNFYTDYLFGDSALVTETLLQGIPRDEELYTILLAHRPELFKEYVKAEVDLVFSGHAHGGQIRLPFLGGVFAPNQGFFPKFDAGLFTEDRTSMIVSRGIGNSLLPLRFNNRPEIVIAELKSA